MKKIILTICILLIPSCTAVNKYIEQSDISSITQEEEKTEYNADGVPISKEKKTITFNKETNTSSSQEVVENAKENWIQKLWTEIKAKVNYIVSIFIFCLVVFLFTKFKVWSTIGKFIMFVNEKFK
jgi:hypothetical protein